MQQYLQKTEQIYSRLLELSVQIEELIDRKIYTELITYLNKKDKLLDEASKYIEKIQKENLNTDNLKLIVQKYQMQEKKNLEKLNNIKNEIKAELIQSTKNQKILKAYGEGEERIYGNILDFRE